MSIRELYVEETVEVTDATLSMHLLDVATGEYVDSVSTLLYSGVWPPGTVTWEMVLATFIGIIVFSFLAALVVGIARGG